MLTRQAKLKKGVKRFSLRLRGRRGVATGAFVFGAQRSGTNMLLAALSQGSRVESINETDEEAFANYRLRSIDTICQLIDSSFADCVVFKPICDSQRAAELLDSIPGSAALWIYRHYDDVVNSALRQFTEHARYLHYMLHEPDIADWRIENVTDEDMALVRQHHEAGLSDASARALIWYLRNTLFFQQGLDSDERVRLICYERTVTQPQETFAAICEHLDIEFDPRMTRSLFRTSVGKSMSPEIEPSIKTLCDELHARLTASAELQARVETS